MRSILCPECGASNAEGSKYCANCGSALGGVGVDANDGARGVVVFTRLLKGVGVIVFLMSAFPLLVGLLKTYYALGGASAAEKAVMLSEGISESFKSGLPWVAGGAVFCIVIFILSHSLAHNANRKARGLPE
jgi:hypothetical protein